MLQRLLLTLLFVPALVQAECSIATTHNGILVVVGKSGAGCLPGTEFRAAFTGQLKLALADEQARAPRRRQFEERNARLRAIEERNARLRTLEQAAAQPAGRYYGQR